MLYAVNSGGTAFMASDGTQFGRDNYYNMGSGGSTTDEIEETTDDMLYQSERWGTFGYNFPLAAGTYDVVLHMVEAYYGANGVAGNRVFNVEVEGEVLVEDFDPLSTAGHDVAHTIELPGIEVTDGLLTLDFAASTGEANVAGIVVKGPEGSVVDLPEVPIENPGTPGPTIPTGCTGESTVSEDDLVLFDGGPLPAMTGEVLAMNENWVLDEAWLAGEASVVVNGDESAIQYTNGITFMGFKFTPPLRRPFNIAGADVYVGLDRPNANAPLPSFGLRVIKPGEEENHGDAPTTTWMTGPNARFETISPECSLISLSMPQGWDVNNGVADRFIWEMQSNWNSSDKLVIRRIVLKGFKYDE